MKLIGIVTDKPSPGYVSAMPEPTPLDLSPRRALAAFNPDDQATWHLRY